MTVYWAKPTLDDITAQRAMIERGEEKRRAVRQAAERERLRDTFAAAALTGLIANGDYSVESTPLLAYRMADAMLHERSRAVTNHDAVPDAIADADRGRTDKAVTRPGDGTGNTPALSETEREAIAQVLDDLNGKASVHPSVPTILRNLLGRTK